MFVGSMVGKKECILLFLVISLMVFKISVDNSVIIYSRFELFK